MEKFMLVFHGGINQEASPQDIQTNMGKWMAWVEKLQKEGKYVSGEALLPGGKLVSGKIPQQMALILRARKLWVVIL